MKNLTNDLEILLDKVFSIISNFALIGFTVQNDSVCFAFGNNFKEMPYSFQLFTAFTYDKAKNILITRDNEKIKFKKITKLLQSVLVKGNSFSINEPPIYFKFSSSKVNLDIRRIGKYYVCLNVPDVRFYGKFRFTTEEKYAKEWISSTKYRYENNLQVAEEQLQEKRMEALFVEKNEIPAYTQLIKKFKEKEVEYNIRN